MKKIVIFFAMILLFVACNHHTDTEPDECTRGSEPYYAYGTYSLDGTMIDKSYENGAGETKYIYIVYLKEWYDNNGYLHKRFTTYVYTSKDECSSWSFTNAEVRETKE